MFFADSTKRFGIVTVLALALVACGGDSTDPVEGPSVSTVASVANVAPITEETAEGDNGEPSGDPVVCHNPVPVEIGLGTAHDGDNTGDIPTVCFWVGVPEGLEELSFQLDGLSADLNLEVGYGFARTLLFNTGEYWDSRNADVESEAIEIVAPSAGPYFIKIGPSGPNQTSAFSLLVMAGPGTVTDPTSQALPSPDECGGPVTELAVGGSVDGEISDERADPLPRAYYCIQAPAGLDTLTIDVTGLTGLLDLFVTRVGSTEVWTDRSRGETLTVTIDSPEATAYYIDVAAALPGATSSFTVSASE